MTDQPSQATRKPPVLRTPMPLPGVPEEPLDEVDLALIQAVLEALAKADKGVSAG